MICPPLWWCGVQGPCPVPCFCFRLFRSGSWGFLVFLHLWGFFGLFVSFIQNLPPTAHHTVIFSPIMFLCILLLEETFVQVQALQQRVPGPSLSQKVWENSTPTSIGPRWAKPQLPIAVASRKCSFLQVHMELG